MATPSMPALAPRKSTTTLRFGWVSLFGYLVFFVYLYLVGPFDTAFLHPNSGVTWNDLLTNLLTILAAVLASMAASLLWKSSGIRKPGWRVWFFLSAGLWLWALGEAIWALYNMTVVEVPAITIADLPWVAGYICFTIALENQYSRVYKPSIRRRVFVSLGLWVLVLLLTLLITGWADGFHFNSNTMGTYLATFYVIADLAVTIVSLVLVFAFQGGAMARPWLGLFTFALADFLYAWLYESGAYTFTTEVHNFISLAADTLYVAAYLILGMGLLAHFLLIKFGLPSVQKYTPSH